MTLRFGILGAGRVLAKFVPAFSLTKDAQLVAIASREVERARQFHPPRVHAGYQALLEDPEVDVVINTLHNGLHCEWTCRTLEAGKHVLCEKPLACSSAEAEKMFATARACRRWLMEGFMYRFHPQIAEAKRLVDAGAIGRVRHVQSAYAGLGRDRDNPRYWKAAGGGALMDLGCYCVNFSRLFAGEPQRVSATAKFDEVDLEMRGTLNGIAEAEFFCSMIEPTLRIGATITGTDGTLEIPHPWLPPRSPAEFIVNGKVVSVPFISPFALEIEHFCECVRQDRAPQFPPDADAETDSRANARVLDALHESARRGAPVDL